MDPRHPSRRGLLAGASATLLAGAFPVAVLAATPRGLPTAPVLPYRMGPLPVPFLMRGEYRADRIALADAMARILPTFLSVDAPALVARARPGREESFVDRAAQVGKRVAAGLPSAAADLAVPTATPPSFVVPDQAKLAASVTIACYAALLRWHALLPAGISSGASDDPRTDLPAPGPEAVGLASGEAIRSLADHAPVQPLSTPRETASWQRSMAASALRRGFAPIAGTPAGDASRWLQLATGYDDYLAGRAPAGTIPDHDAVVAVNAYVERDVFGPVSGLAWTGLLG